jgi:hypothetical protein
MIFGVLIGGKLIRLNAPNIAEEISACVTMATPLGAAAHTSSCRNNLNRGILLKIQTRAWCEPRAHLQNRHFVILSKAKMTVFAYLETSQSNPASDAIIQARSQSRAWG